MVAWILGGAMNAFLKLGIGQNPLILAPLAGVSDHPFRRVCESAGANLTYVEMLSATAMIYQSKRTMEMLTRHPSEKKLGVQVTAKTPHEMAQAAAMIDQLDFDTLDINMGCPVKKVVSVGCGSAILRDPKRVYETTKAARENTSKPLSVKIRLGWSKSELTYKEVALAAQEAGADWLTVHGRTRNDDYSEPVDLEKISELVALLDIPVIGNGNIFSKADADMMMAQTGCAGVMVSRGALGNPWLFREIATGNPAVGLSEWVETVLNHLDWQNEAYGAIAASTVCMRKHLLWYTSGWFGARKVRDDIVRCQDNEKARQIIIDFAQELAEQGFIWRIPTQLEQNGRFAWDPKFEMDRKLDRGVGDELTDPAATESIATC